MPALPAATTFRKALRWLDLTAELLSRRMSAPAADLQRLIPGYQARDGAALHRMFERDKDELRQLDVPIETTSGGEDAVVGYRLRATHMRMTREQQLAPAAIAIVQRAVARVNDAPPDQALDAACALRWLGCGTGLDLRDLSPSEGAWKVDQLFELAAAAAVHGHLMGGAAGDDMHTDLLAGRLGVPTELLRALVSHATDRPAGTRTMGRAVRFISEAPHDMLAVVATELRQGWRPARRHAEALRGLLHRDEEEIALGERMVDMSRA